MMHGDILLFSSACSKQDQDMTKVTLDNHCGKVKTDFNAKRNFLNHVRKHSEEMFLCPKCPPIWEGGTENQFNTKKVPVFICFSTQINIIQRKACSIISLNTIIQRTNVQHVTKAFQHQPI